MLEVHFADGGALIATEGGTRKSMRVGLYDAAASRRCSGTSDRSRSTTGVRPRGARRGARPDARQLNALLRDGRAIAGIGRAFADEILHAARLSPFASSTRLGRGRERL